MHCTRQLTRRGTMGSCGVRGGLASVERIAVVFNQACPEMTSGSLSICPPSRRACWRAFMLGGAFSTTGSRSLRSVSALPLRRRDGEIWELNPSSRSVYSTCMSHPIRMMRTKAGRAIPQFRYVRDLAKRPTHHRLRAWPACVRYNRSRLPPVNGAIWELGLSCHSSYGTGMPHPIRMTRN